MTTKPAPLDEPDGRPLRQPALADRPDALARHVALDAGAPVREALASLTTGRADVVLVVHGGAAHALTRGDLERVLPSPATALARHEIPALLDRVAVRHAFRAPARTIRASATPAEAARALRDGGWRPLVVTDGSGVLGVVTAESLLSALLRDRPADAGGVRDGVR